MLRQSAHRSLELRIAKRRTAQLLDDPKAREHARLQMAFVLEKSRPDADIEAAAERYIEISSMRPFYRWNPKLASKLTVIDDHYFDALQHKTGGVLAFCHHGQYDNLAAAMARYKLDLHIAVDGFGLSAEAEPFHRQHYRVVGRGAASLVNVDVEPQRLGELVMEGENIVLAPDVPGRTPATIFGRDVLGSFGAALLPFKTGKPLVLLTNELDADGVLVARAHEPLMPADFEKPMDLHLAMLAIFEKAVLDLPEFYERPLTRFDFPADSPDEAKFRIDGPFVV